MRASHGWRRDGGSAWHPICVGQRTAGELGVGNDSNSAMPVNVLVR